MKGLPASMSSLIKQFAKMPGIGTKTAERLAFYILKNPADIAGKMARSIIKVKSSVRFCAICNNLSDSGSCDICANPARDRRVVCVVENPNDVMSIEKMGSYTGVYHVLLGALSPLDGIGPGDIKIDHLISRVNKGGIKEVIIATDSNTEGEATALYLVKLLRRTAVKITRIALGLPVGANLEYADQATLLKALEGRITV